MTVAPSGFVGHGSPLNALGGPIAEQWSTWGASWEDIDSILVVSAHFEALPPTLSSTRGVPLVYDFWGFPDEMYRLGYEPPGAPHVANAVERLVPGTRRDETRGLDHGAWVPLLHLVPAEDVPVIQLSIPWTNDPEAMWELGGMLAPLRADGTVILGSGNIVHNLRRVDWTAEGGIPAWADDFDGWVAYAVEEDRARDLAGYRKHPLAGTAHPTQEHFVPLLVAAGAAAGDEVSFPVSGFELGSISARSIQFGVS